MGSTTGQKPITTVIFDLDDTLYDVGTGFTFHRNTDGASSFMVEKLGFPSKEEAMILRNKYFERYHSTAKGLVVAEEEGMLIYPLTDKDDEERRVKENAKKFNPKELSHFWATKLDFSILKKQNNDTNFNVEGERGWSRYYKNVRDVIQSCPLKKIIFSNGPHEYVERVLKEIGILDLFAEEHIFGVDDVLPFCKPEENAFRYILEKCNISSASECIMVEDSMKNIRAAKCLGMRTVLITGMGRLQTDECQTGGVGTSSEAALLAESTKPGDAPDKLDAAVDFAIEYVGQMKPNFWDK